MIDRDDDDRLAAFIDLARAELLKLGQACGLEIGDMPAAIADNAAFINVSAYAASRHELSVKWYHDVCGTLNLEESLIGKDLVDSEGRRMNLAGVDPDGGRAFFRLIDQEGGAHFLDLESFQQLRLVHHGVKS